MNSRTPELSRLTLMCSDHEVAEFTWNHDRQAVTGKTHVLDAAHAPLMATDPSGNITRDRLSSWFKNRGIPDFRPDAANAGLDAAKQANVDAISKLDAAKQAVKDAESAKAAADVELANAKAAKDTADASVTAAQQKVDEAQAKLDSADAQLKQGAIGFFRAMGAEDAANIILNAKYAGKTEVGNSKDATSLDNMLNAIRWMKSVNDYRKSVGLSELHVTYKLIAGAIADANYSDTVLDHARQYDFAENLAWNYGIDPSGQWIEQEKGFFDKATEALYGVTGLVGKDAYDFYAKNGVAINHWIANNCRWENGSSGTVGHYMNIINPELAVMGMATCTKGTMSGLQTQCYTAEISGWSGSGWNTNPISVDEYEQKLTSYINGLKNAKSALDVAKADLASKQRAAAGAAATVQQKQDAADSAQADVDAAKQDVTDAQRAVDAAKADVAASSSRASRMPRPSLMRRNRTSMPPTRQSIRQSRPSSRSRSPLMLPTQP